jgi:tetraacyldisaccharide 4'-kinase
VRPPRSVLLSTLLAPLAWVYGTAVRARSRRYDREGASRRAPIPVLSVGNLAAGGTGKTPMVAWLVRCLAAEGRKPAVVTRGYGGRAGKGPLLVSSGDGPLAGPEVSGDEPVLLARALPGVSVLAGSDRLAGASAAAAEGADVVVLDDGFQHRRLARDLDLVLLDGTEPFGNGRLLPAGPLREPKEALARASAVIVTRCRPAADLSAIAAEVARHAPGVPVFRAGHRRLGFAAASGAPAARPARAVAFCGIGNPVPFLRDLEEEGVDVIAARVFADHHPYQRREIRGLEKLAARHGAALVTTEKDLVRVPTATGGPVLALRIETVVHDAEPLVALVRAALVRAVP